MSFVVALIVALIVALCGAAHGQAVTAPPAGARVVTVLLCDQADGCPEAARALFDHAADVGFPVMDFDRVAAAALAGEADRARYEAALGTVRGGTASLAQAEEARAALQELPFTVPAADAQAIDLVLAARLLQQGRTAEADRAFGRAASGTAGALVDLPPLPQVALERYAAAIDLLDGEPAALTVEATGGVVFVDGGRAGLAPVTVGVAPGWHRVSVERTGRRTAWVGEVTVLQAHASAVRADADSDDGVDSVEAALVGATSGVGGPEPEPVERLSRWASDQGLAWLRFVRVVPEGELGQRVPEERFAGPDGRRWGVLAIWLEVDRGALTASGPGPAAVVSGGRPRPFGASLGLGYLRLGAVDHASVGITARLRFHRWVVAEARVGVLRAGVPYYLYDDWVDPHLFPVELGAIAGRDSGPFGGLSGLVVIPYALGGEAVAGWAFTPGARWRFVVEGRGGWTDHGALGGLALSLGRVR